MKTISILKDNEIQKRINNSSYFDVESFNQCARRFVQALKENRIIATITRVSSSGMSRNIKIVEMHKGTSGKYYILNFQTFFKVLGYKTTDNGEIVISGCGMDVIFGTIYNVLGSLEYNGILTHKERENLKAYYNLI